MTALVDYAADTYSQFGEDGIIEHIFNKIGRRSAIAVEFGAGDGLSCSNTAKLWRDESWRAYLIEPDAGRYEQLLANYDDHLDTVESRRTFVTPTGPQSIGSLLSEMGLHKETVDYMSIDVDGDDYAILAALDLRPRVISIEFNPTVPPHLEMRQTELGDTFGASLLALIRLGETLGYTFVGATRCNAFLVVNDDADPFLNYERDPQVLFSPGNYTYMVTDFAGRTTLCGQALPWEAKEPYVMPLHATGYLAPVTDDPQYLRRGFEARWGPARWFAAAGIDREALKRTLLEERPPLVLVDLTLGPMSPLDWIWVGAEAPHYRASLIGRVLGLVLQKDAP